MSYRFNASPQICVAVGNEDIWISADQDEADIIEEIEERFGKDAAWEVTGCEDFGDINAEMYDLSEVSEIAQFLAKYDEDLGSAVLLEYGLSIKRAEMAMEYISGPYRDDEDYALQELESMHGPLPHIIINNLKWSGVVEDLLQFRTGIETDSGEFYVIEEH